MTKQDLVRMVAEEANVSEDVARQIVDLVLSVVRKHHYEALDEWR